MYPPLEQSALLFADAGWRVRLVAVEPETAMPSNLRSHRNVQLYQLPFCGPGVVQKLHYFWFVAVALRHALFCPTDWIYASDLFASPVAALLSFAGFRVIYHEHDDPGTPKTLFMRCLSRIRAWTGKKVNTVVIPNEQRKAQFVEATGRSRTTHVVWNVPLRSEAELAQQKPEHSIVFIYQGSIVPERLPATVIQAFVHLSKNATLLIVGYETIGHRGYIKELLDTAATAGVGSQVKYLGVFSRGELLRITRTAHVGLSLMPMESDDLNMRNMVGASNKAFEYLAAGCALMVSALPEWQKVVVDNSLGLSCDPRDVRSVVSTMQSFLDNPASAQRMGERGRQLVLGRWNYEREFGSVIRSIERF